MNLWIGSGRVVVDVAGGQASIGGPGGVSGGDCLPAFRSGTFPTPSTKKPKYAYGMLGLWTHGLWLYPTDQSGNLFRIGTFSHHEGMSQNPHFIHGNREHDQKRDRHENVAGQQG